MKFVYCLFLLFFASGLHAQTGKLVSPDYAAFNANGESVNKFDGSLSFEIPLGRRFRVTEAVNYQLALRYSNKVWTSTRSSDGTYTLGPTKSSNTGLGWILSLGRLVADTGTWYYEDASGTRHAFYPTLHYEEYTYPNNTKTDPDPDIWYTRDGTYMRLVVASIGSHHTVEMPDGTAHKFHRFDAAASASESHKIGDLNLILDRDTSKLVTVSRLKANGSTPARWEITDSTSSDRKQVVEFRSTNSANNYAQVVSAVKFQTTTSATLNYIFSYTNELTTATQPYGEACGYYATGQRTRHAVPMLTGIAIQDSNGANFGSYLFEYHLGDTTSECGSGAGALKKMTLPERGTVEWTYQEYKLPTESCVYDDDIEEWDYREDYATTSGVYTWQYKDADGTSAGLWKQERFAYSSNPATRVAVQCDWVTLPGEANPEREEFTTTITRPGGMKEVNYFTVWPEQYGSGTGNAAAGLPNYGTAFSPITSKMQDGMYLSQQVYSGATLQSSTYVKYEVDTFDSPSGSHRTSDRNGRIVKTRTIYNADTGCGATCRKDVEFSRFDGLGHYRESVVSTNFGSSKTSKTEFNSTRGVYPAPTGSTYQPLTWPGPWLIQTFNKRELTEGTSAITTTYSFNSVTGAMETERRLAGASEGMTDLLTTYTVSGGLVTKKHFSGGDTGGNEYTQAYTYSAGVLETEKWLDQNAALTLQTVDNTTNGAVSGINSKTGLVVTTRDAAERITALEYDALGRIKWVKPSSTSSTAPWREYIYTTAAAEVPGVSAGISASTRINERENGTSGAVLRETMTEFDGFGRPVREKQRMPGGAWSVVTTTYDTSGRKSSVTQLVAEGTTNPAKTSFTYDFASRPLTTTTPDGKVTTMTYTGARKRTRTVKIGTTKQVTGLNVTGVSEENAVTTEDFDAHGRLITVTEPEGVTAQYTYDAADRLINASLTGDGQTQPRKFFYDGRGLLTKQEHPEQTEQYASFDALGNPRRRWSGTAYDLTMTYDRAARVTHVKETGGTQRLVKEFVYGTMTETLAADRGQLVKAIRHNFDRLASDVVVSDTYTYADPAGRLSQQKTCIGLGTCDTTDKQFSTGYTYNKAGNVQTMTYPTCAGAANCGTFTPSRTAEYGYNASNSAFLMSVTANTSALAIYASAPISGNAGVATTITITGQQFAVGATVTVGGVAVPPAQVFVDSSTQIRATVPTTLSAGAVHDVVVTVSGQASTLKHAYFVNFLDATTSHGFRSFIETIYRNGLTTGCGNGNYCPEDVVLRGQMAVFVGRAMLGSDSVAPSFSTYSFTDLSGDIYRNWIELLYQRGVIKMAANELSEYPNEGTGRCSWEMGANKACPSAEMTRQLMAVWLLRAKHGKDYVPPTPTSQRFSDVPLTSIYAPWIEQLYQEGTTGGCGGTSFCPLGVVDRGQMAVFLKANFGLTSGPGNLKAGATFTYHANGALKTIQHDNGVLDSQELRADGLLGRMRTTYGGRAFDSGKYEYDGGGNITRAGSDYYLYDKVARLKEASVGYLSSTANNVQTYQYDAFGNLKQTARSTNGGTATTTTISASLASNRLNPTGTVYNDAGSMTNWTTPGGMVSTASYDAAGMPRALVMNGVTSRYFYNANDERVWVQKTVSSTIVSDYTLRGTGNQVVRRFRTTGANGAEVWNSSEDSIHALGKIIAVATNTSTNHYHLDHLGSSRVVTNAARGTVAAHDYYPFGEEVTDLAQSSQPYRFTGHERDFTSTVGAPTTTAETIDYMHARYYSPVLGRFLSVDPILGDPRAPQSWNRYSYVGNNPTNFIDPDGMLKESTYGASITVTATNPCPWQTELGPCQSETARLANGIGRVQEWLTPIRSTFDVQNARQFYNNVSYNQAASGNMFGSFAAETLLTALPETQTGLGAQLAITLIPVGRIAQVAGKTTINVLPGLRHVIDGHTVVGTMTAGKSVFAAGENLVTLIKSAAGATPRTGAGGRLIYVVDAGRTVGTTQFGRATSVFTVVTDRAGKLITAHPGLPAF